MTDQLDETITAPGTTQESGRPAEEFFEFGRPRLGGVPGAVTFSTRHQAVINAVADTMIPPGGGFPAPSEVEITTFFSRYTTPRGFTPRHFPFATEEGLTTLFEDLGDAFVDAEGTERTQRLKNLETDDPELFGIVRALVYHGYYQAPAVTLAIRATLPAGRDYHGAPLPDGYIDCIEDWDDEALASAGQGRFLNTDEVRPVDVSDIDWIKSRAAQN